MENVLVLEKEKSIAINKDLIIALTKSFGLIILKICLVGMLGTNIYTTLNEYKSSQIIPVKIEKVDELKRIKESLAILNCPPEKIQPLAESIHTGAKVAQVDPVLFTALMCTESKFKINARSSMGYKSLMQTPTATGYINTDVMHGADILREKMKISDNNIHKALTFYKGSKYNSNTKGYKQATEVLNLYKSISLKLPT